MAGCGGKIESDGLSDGAVRVFGLIAEGARVTDSDARFVDELVTAGFVVLDAQAGNRPVALDPRGVAERRMRAALEEAAARVAMLKALPDDTEQLVQRYERAQWRAGAGSEYIDDVTVVNARLDDIVAGAKVEILAAQPGGPRTREQLNRSLARDTHALDRGVRKRTLYRATVRDTAVTGEYARAMTGRGAEYRTLVEPFERAIIVDRKTAVISNHLVEGAPEHAAWLITDRAVVSYIAAEWEAKWRRADVWCGELRLRSGQGVDTVSGAEGVGVRTTRRQREILRDVAAGQAQQSTADRLGISLRTLTGQINELKALFGAESLPELVYKWALSVDRHVDDSAPDLQDGGGGERSVA